MSGKSTIRISPQDLERIKKKAAAAGIPYQKLIGAISSHYASVRITTAF